MRAMVDLAKPRRAIQDSRTLIHKSSDALNRTQERLVRSENLLSATLTSLLELPRYRTATLA